MIVLDTNVISETRVDRPHPAVVAWMQERRLPDLYLTTITLAELRYGIEGLASGRKRRSLEAWFDATRTLYVGRLLAFDEAAATKYGAIAADMRVRGRAIGRADAYIAAIVASRNATIATRDTGPFAAAGMRVVDPWAAPPGA